MEPAADCQREGDAKVTQDQREACEHGEDADFGSAHLRGVCADEAHPILFKWHTPARILSLPFLPVTPTFPLLGPLGFLPLPAKWVIRVGKPIALDHLGADAASDELLISRLTEELRSRIQSLVGVALSDRESIWG